jgi:hypothetical protein
MKRLLFTGLFAAATWVGARAVDVSGTYENAGSMVRPGSPAEAGIISLQGLCTLEFDHALTRALHTQTDRVVVRQSDSAFIIECHDRDGAVTWSGRWARDMGYGVDPGQVNLLFRSKRFEPDGFLFSLSLAGDGQLLLIDVRRIKTTWLGPVGEPIGVFLFNRIAGKSPESSK